MPLDAIEFVAWTWRISREVVACLTSEFQLRGPGVPWSRPTKGVIKLNWDAAICKTSKNMGVGVVIRMSLGVFGLPWPGSSLTFFIRLERRLLCYGMESTCVSSWVINRLSSKSTP